MANSGDPDEMPHSAASHLGLHYLLRPVCLNTYDKYGTSNSKNSITFKNEVHLVLYFTLCFQVYQRNSCTDKIFKGLGLAVAEEQIFFSFFFLNSVSFALLFHLSLVLTYALCRTRLKISSTSCE